MFSNYKSLKLKSCKLFFKISIQRFSNLNNFDLVQTIQKLKGLGVRKTNKCDGLSHTHKHAHTHTHTHTHTHVFSILNQIKNKKFKLIKLNKK